MHNEITVRKGIQAALNDNFMNEVTSLARAMNMEPSFNVREFDGQTMAESLVAHDDYGKVFTVGRQFEMDGVVGGGSRVKVDYLIVVGVPLGQISYVKKTGRSSELTDQVSLIVHGLFSVIRKLRTAPNCDITMGEVSNLMWSADDNIDQDFIEVHMQITVDVELR